MVPVRMLSRNVTSFFVWLTNSALLRKQKTNANSPQEEAAAGRERTCKFKENLTPQSRKCDPPYSANQISETAKHREVQQIFSQASPETRPIYEWGLIMESNGAWDNWIIRWCLWHVFRYRDDRNRNRGSHSTRVVASSEVSSPSPPYHMAQSGMVYASPSPTYASYSPTYAVQGQVQYANYSTRSATGNTFYDPIHHTA